ncbi:TPA: sugar-binding transcriptional regulator [Kluyvera ascorbata]|uniref:Cro/Cl family transcriptional regulator n=1 Tax=Kluyvera genomosp. 2 TaxID=2774054 RepID=A0A2T2XZU5_9ENTR|nr:MULTISPECIES: sugar-binding transcriptional regulator [Enterobacteriaceae]HAT3919964.1 sugar-binding transcriptional regulator [Kluyvera ascorbata]PSR45782.1 Cro/Cl family transcriptional regulator [Kluyvera genomosp. 2]BBQ85981.1 Cro/Cl family transcriptional regulator [Klebsiella sp. WP3-W18-ESBL-02]BBR22964.1 Cro/Cl family transcriptional regulator [Klebsiella sp. WP3-S18-ESBL-05]HAT3944751.1 sugar-binding transcriptional regulator [Kluyvera ascorbata]
MENSDDIRLIVKIAQLYYEQEMTQAQIAQSLGIYRTTISRLLKRGRELGVVTIAINYDYNDSLWLEEQLKQIFGLKEAAVAPQEAELGAYGAPLVERLLSANAIIGFGWGRAVSMLVESLPTASQPRQHVCVPIVGGPSGKLPSRYHVNTLTYAAAERLKAESYLADFPALLDNPTIRNGIMQSQHYQTLAGYWQKLDVALVGIGSPAIRHGANWQAFYGNAQSDELIARGVAGDICSRFFDSDGATVLTDMHEKTLSIPLSTLRQARDIVGIAAGEEKYDAILGALRGKHINTLVTDRATADYLVRGHAHD